MTLSRKPVEKKPYFSNSPEDVIHAHLVPMLTGYEKRNLALTAKDSRSTIYLPIYIDAIQDLELLLQIPNATPENITLTPAIQIYKRLLLENHAVLDEYINKIVKTAEKIGLTHVDAQNLKIAKHYIKHYCAVDPLGSGIFASRLLVIGLPAIDKPTLWIKPSKEIDEQTLQLILTFVQHGTDLHLLRETSLLMTKRPSSSMPIPRNLEVNSQVREALRVKTQERGEPIPEFKHSAARAR
jgi:hypothetical protein